MRRRDWRAGGENIFQRQIDKSSKAATAADIMNQKPDLQPIRDGADALQHVVACNVELQRSHLGAAFLAHGLGGLRERAGLARDENDVHTLSAERAGQMLANALRSAHDDGPRAVFFFEWHIPLPRLLHVLQLVISCSLTRRLVHIAFRHAGARGAP